MERCNFTGLLPSLGQHLSTTLEHFGVSVCCVIFTYFYWIPMNFAILYRGSIPHISIALLFPRAMYQ
jgi:hypothetical protein